MKRFLIPIAFLLGAIRCEDYYGLLKIGKNATTTEIKKAFRALAVKYHPDKNPDGAEMFQKISAAYEVLSNEETRKIYDNGGEEALKRHKEGGHDAHHDPFDLFSMFGFGGGQRRREGTQKTPDTKFKLFVSLEQAFNGEMFSVIQSRDEVCMHSSECTVDRRECQAPGVKVFQQQVGPGFMVQNQMRDDTCISQGKGWIPKCRQCPNGPSSKKLQELSVFVDPGMTTGDSINFHARSDEKVGFSAGDFIVEIKVQKHPKYTREGNDLYMNFDVSVLDSLVGFKTEFKHIDGEMVTVESTSVIEDDQIMLIPNRGMPCHPNNKFGHCTSRGNLFIKYNVVFPTGRVLTEAQKQGLETIRNISPSIRV